MGLRFTARVALALVVTLAFCSHGDATEHEYCQYLKVFPQNNCYCYFPDYIKDRGDCNDLYRRMAAENDCEGAPSYELHDTRLPADKRRHDNLYIFKSKDQGWVLGSALCDSMKKIYWSGKKRDLTGRMWVTGLNVECYECELLSSTLNHMERFFKRVEPCENQQTDAQAWGPGKEEKHGYMTFDDKLQQWSISEEKCSAHKVYPTHISTAAKDPHTDPWMLSWKHLDNFHCVAPDPHLEPILLPRLPRDVPEPWGYSRLSLRMDFYYSLKQQMPERMREQDVRPAGWYRTLLRRIKDDKRLPINRRTVFVLHSFWNDFENSWVKEIGKKIMTLDNINYVMVGWDRGGDIPKGSKVHPSKEYLQAASNSRAIAQYLSEMLCYLRMLGIKHEMYCIGHDIGAHICAQASRLSGCGARFDRITGLDPAGSLFDDILADLRLSPKDADYVDVLHTNGKPSGALDHMEGIYYGTMLPLGHDDFYFEGGEIQRACTHSLCSHTMGYWYFIASISKEPERCNVLHQCLITEGMPELCDVYDFPVTFAGYHAQRYAQPGAHRLWYIHGHKRPPYCRGTPWFERQFTNNASVLQYEDGEDAVGKYEWRI